VVEALQELARLEAGVHAPPHLESRIMAAWDESRVARSRESRRRALGVAAAVAAGILLAATAAALRGAHGTPIAPPIGQQRLSPDPPPVAFDVTDPVPPAPAAAPVRRAATPPQAGAVGQPRGAATPMTLVVVGEPLTTEEPVRVVRMRVDAARLAWNCSSARTGSRAASGSACRVDRGKEERRKCQGFDSSQPACSSCCVPGLSIPAHSR
jgi:hypothetical protein